MEERLITVDDLIAGGCCREGVMESADPTWPTAFSVSAALVEARKRKQVDLVRRALNLDGYSDGRGYSDGDGDGYGYSDGRGDGDGYSDGDGYGSDDGYGDGYGSGYGFGFGDGDGSGHGYGYGYDDD